MSVPDPSAEWVAKADNDVLNIENNLAAERVPWDTVCFHAQQAAEKLLKGFLIHHARPLQRTHDLVVLVTECAAIEPSLAGLRTDCQALTYYAVAPRYPDTLVQPDEAEGRAMVAAMQRIRAAILPLLAAPPPTQ